LPHVEPQELLQVLHNLTVEVVDVMRGVVSEPCWAVLGPRLEA
jgi:hypothetical protein